VDANTKVSVIIPAYNAQELIAKTLDSILAQTYKNIEIIVVDDGSTDNTSQIVHGYQPWVHCYYQNNSGGCAVPRNTGIKHGTGDFLCFMDADDLMVPDRVARQVEFMERYPDVGLVFCDYRNFSDDGLYPTSHFETCPRLWEQLKGKKEIVLEKACPVMAQENFGIAGSFLLRKGLLALETGFEPSLKACEDFHFFYRLARHTQVGIINEVGMMRRMHGNNMTGNPVKMFTEGIRSRSFLRDTEQDLIVRAQLERHIYDCKSSLARHLANEEHYLHSLRCDWEIISGDISWTGVKNTLRNVIRTILLATGLYKSSDAPDKPGTR
jgi:GT2 family glycosyltransferase